jgi:hypothetical protein
VTARGRDPAGTGPRPRGPSRPPDCGPDGSTRVLGAWVPAPGPRPGHPVALVANEAGRVTGRGRDPAVARFAVGVRSAPRPWAAWSYAGFWSWALAPWRGVRASRSPSGPRCQRRGLSDGVGPGSRRRGLRRRLRAASARAALRPLARGAALPNGPDSTICGSTSSNNVVAPAGRPAWRPSGAAGLAPRSPGFARRYAPLRPLARVRASRSPTGPRRQRGGLSDGEGPGSRGRGGRRRGPIRPSTLGCMDLRCFWEPGPSPPGAGPPIPVTHRPS